MYTIRDIYPNTFRPRPILLRKKSVMSVLIHSTPEVLFSTSHVVSNQIILLSIPFSFLRSLNPSYLGISEKSPLGDNK